MNAFNSDLDALAVLGWGPERIDEMAETGHNPGDLATFLALEREHRSLVLRLLADPSEADFDEMAALPEPFGRNLAGWILSLPAYRNADYGDDME